MKNAVHKRTKITAVMVVALLLVTWWLPASVRGYLVAQFDVARGHYELQSYGLPAPGQSEYVRLLRERYGIEHRRVAGCVVTESLISYVNAYNGVAGAAAKRKFGRDVFAECAADARKAWISRTPRRR